MAESMKDPYKFLNLVPNPDGSITRLPVNPTIPPSTDTHTISKDIPLNTSHNTFIRIFKPISLSPPTTKLPLILFFHGGGFVLFSADTHLFHNQCSLISAHTPALLLSLNYRKAPEHRLPAAYDDAVEFIHWLRNQALEVNTSVHWLKDHANFSRVFLMGSSAGGNIVYNAGLRALEIDSWPVKITGLILNQPYFGGVQRSGSETRFAKDRILPLPANDLMWELSLPKDTDRNHEFCNPMIGGSRDERIGRLGKCLVYMSSNDPLVDRQKEFVEMLVARGVEVVARVINGGGHAVDLFDRDMGEALRNTVKDFIESCCGLESNVVSAKSSL